MNDIYDKVRALKFILMQRFLTAASPICVYDEWRVRCMSRYICPDTGMRKLRIDQDFLIEHWNMMYIMSMLSWMKFSFNIV